MTPLVKPFLPPREELLPALEEVLYSGYIAEGEQVKAFESAFGNWISNPYCLSLNSGTAGLHLSFMMMGIKEGDEVISTALTAEPTNVAIKLTGAKVVWADIDPQTGVIDPGDVENKITEKTKAIVVVHYAGIVADLGRLKGISQRYNVPMVEDAAHALGAKYESRHVGSHSPYTIFSFQAIKHMTTIDGGMLSVLNEEKFDEGRLRRWFGLDKTKSRKDNDIFLQGSKYHMNNVNATIGLLQLKYLSENIKSHVENGRFYDEALIGIPGAQLLKYYPQAQPSYWLYTLLVENRDFFIKHLSDNGITASELHKRNDLHSFFSESKASLPQLDEFYSRMVHIPCGWWVSREERERIAAVIQQGW